MVRVRTSARSVLWAGLLLAASACTSDREYAVLIRAFGPTEEALQRGTEIRLDAWLIEGDVRETAPPTVLEQDVAEGGSLRASVQLSGPAEIMVRLEARGGGGVFAATRCYAVVGVSESDVMLSGPLGEEADPDGDGWPSVDSCVPRADGVGCDALCPEELVRDCQPDDPDAHPRAEDPCGDIIDQDCDGTPDPCADDDGDGVPRCAEGEDVGCDCDDGNADIGPGVDEGPSSPLCDNDLDDDCDGEDQRCDDDGDGVPRCPDEQPVPVGCDCNDGDDTIHPGASETPGGVCNGIDDNCNDIVDEDVACLGDDLDLDGSEVGDDCNDCSAAMSPGGTERCGDSIDGACELGGRDDGTPLPPGTDDCDPDDADGDGAIAATAGGTDCDDADADRYPNAPDRCDDGLDGDCSGGDSSCATDGDDDGFNADNDCDDADGTRAPGLADGCNGVDDDCDGIIDEDLEPGTGCVLTGEDWATIEFGTDLLHCGHCRGSCNLGCSGALCRADDCADGTCLCGPDPACEGGLDEFCCPDVGCRDLVTDPENCGGCGIECPGAECNAPTCVDGSCDNEPAPDGYACSSGRVCCGGDCTGTCAPDAVEPRACGNCGTQTRTCDDDCEWGTFGACSGTGPCGPGQTETRDCGNCGTQTRTCSGLCAWGDWGACSGEGACAPDAIRQTPCGQCGNQEQRCSDSCQWANQGSCDNNPPGASCDDGSSCTNDSCSSSGQCNHTDNCSGSDVCCNGSCQECCGGDTSGCGNEPLCADWACNNGSCVPAYEQRNRDPEGECSGHRCCTGAGSCADTEQNC